jgi:hypothetical protein
MAFFTKYIFNFDIKEGNNEWYILPSTTTLNLGQRNKSKFGIELHSKIPSIKSGFVHYIPLSLQNSHNNPSTLF